MMQVADYFNDGEILYPNYNISKYGIKYSTSSNTIESTNWMSATYGQISFKSTKDCDRAIEILGEDIIKLAFTGIGDIPKY